MADNIKFSTLIQVQKEQRKQKQKHSWTEETETGTLAVQLDKLDNKFKFNK